jgi:hypothetical protein
MRWTGLGSEDWRHHPLNRIRGWLIVVILFLAIEGPLQSALLLAGALADFDTFKSVFDNQVSDWIEWAQLLVPTVGGTVLLVLLFMRVRRFPELYFALRGLAYFVAIATGAFAGWTFGWFRAVQAVLIAVEIALVWYLFTGARPNMVFKHRVKLPA